MTWTLARGCELALFGSLAVVALMPLACAEGARLGGDGLPSESDDDDDDGDGGAGGNAHGPVGSTGSGVGPSSSTGVGPGPSSASSVGPGPSSSSGSGGCDGTLQCETCSNCAINGPCLLEADTCFNNQNCMAFGDCIYACSPTDDVCLNTCVTTYPAGEQLYSQLMFCVLCNACYVDCDGASAGC